MGHRRLCKPRHVRKNTQLSRDGSFELFATESLCARQVGSNQKLNAHCDSVFVWWLAPDLFQKMRRGESRPALLTRFGNSRS
jgi:hypothetical protein